MKLLNFTSQWNSHNIRIQYELKNKLHAFFIVLFFKKWISYTKKPYNKTVAVEFRKKPGIEEIQGTLFTYQRVIKNDTIITYVYNINWLRALLRSCYKFLVTNASVVDIPELYLAIVRKSVLEPLEFYKYQEGWYLIHSSVFNYKDCTFVIAAD